jgi:hypothetical protein
MRRNVAGAIRLVIALTAAVLLVDAAVSIYTGIYLNLGTGVWLALARDVRDGIFYRPIWNGAEYGGTRYFPMLFVPIGALMRAGVAAVPAGLIVSLGGLIALLIAVWRLLERWSVPRPLASFGAALVAAPYFVHQTGFAVRCEPLAAAFAVAGLAALGQPRVDAPTTRRLLLAAALFVGGFAAKITCVYAPAAAVAALLVARRWRDAARLAAFTAVGAAVFLSGVYLLSDGRVLEAFRTNALAGSDPASLVGIAAVIRPIQLIAGSHILTVVFALAAAALVPAWRRGAELPVLYLLAALAVTAVIFTSPGTIITSQIVDAYAAAIVLLVIAAARLEPPVTTMVSAILVGVALWAAAQNAVRIVRHVRVDVPPAAHDRQRLLEALRACHGSMVSESAMAPILANERPVLLDPFAFHVVGLKRPEVTRSLVDRIERTEFACVILEQDPTTERGRAWYRNVNLTADVAEAVLRRYRLDEVIAGQRIYRAVRP